MQPASPSQVAHGLEAIIDAAAGILAEHSLTATLHGMARALGEIVPFTSLALYEADHEARELAPVFAVGRYVEQTLADRPPFDRSIAGGVVLSGEMAHITVSDPRLSEYTVPNTPVDEKEAIVVVPLIVGADVIGTLNVWREGSDAPSFAVEEAELIRRFSTLAALAYANARQRERLIAQALTDELTGLSNRRHFHQRVPAELSRAAREHTATSLILFDLDDFKAINDGYGHPAGDAVLAAFAAILRDEARASDLACRIGGEEFAVLLPNTSTPDAVAFGRRVLQATRDGVRRPDTSALTASAGVATAVGGDLMAADLLSRADSRLLAAKAAGKDRLEAAPSVVACPTAAGG